MTAPESSDNYRVVIYCRVSTNDSDQTNATQERECRRWCESKGWEVLEVYTDEMTGTKSDRPGFSLMMWRILGQKDVDFVVAYDQSRITRGEDYDQIRSMLEDARCRLRYVSLDIDETNIGGKIATDVLSRINSEENKVRNAKTKLGMQTRRIEGKHIGRPARIMFIEDKDVFPKGRYKDGYTLPVTEDYIFSFAEKGVSLYELATKILEVNFNTLVNEMRLRDPSNPKCDYKGIKDRYTHYMTLFETSRELQKGLVAERVENQAKITSERVVSE